MEDSDWISGESSIACERKGSRMALFRMIFWKKSDFRWSTRNSIFYGLSNPSRMNHIFNKPLLLVASAIFVTFPIGNAYGQAAKATSEKPMFDDLPSPEFGGGKNKAFKPKEWLEIEVKLNLQLSPEPATKTCDKLTVKWYIAVKNADRAGTFLLLTKDIDYVNIPTGEDIFFSVYLSPSSIKRLTGLDRGGKSAVEYVGYEVLINGEKVAQETSKGQPGWWNTASEKISRSDKVPLLNKTETPFSAMWWDRYAEVSQERR